MVTIGFLLWPSFFPGLLAAGCMVAKIHANIKASAFPGKGAHVTHYHYLARFRQKVPNICIYFA
jgi:hypothetical protein